MKVAQENVANLQAQPFRIIQVLLNVALRVNDDGRRRVFIADEIGSMRKAAQIVLFQNHFEFFL
jgi:hypothetical protein